MTKVFRVWSEHGRVSGLGESGEPEAHLRAEFGAGRYELQARLGGGASSDVYRALDRTLRRLVALKVYRPLPDAQAEALFAEEARQLAWLEHPNLVTLYDAGIEDGHPFLVLQHVDGVTLGSRLEQGSLSLDQTIALGVRLSDVLAYVHERGIAHRGVQPASVLVDEDDVYLSDFGISRVRGNAALHTSAYLAPEQLQHRGVGPAADIYSLALVLLECLTGEPQFPSTALATALARLTRRPIVPDGLPEPLRDALEAMTAADPGARPTADECGAAFALCAPLLPGVGFDQVIPQQASSPDNLYQFDAARRRRPVRGEEASFEDEDTQPLPLVDVMWAGEPDDVHSPGRRHRALPGRRRRWLRLAATGAVGVALAGGVVIAASGAQEMTVRRVAGPPAGSPVVTEPDTVVAGEPARAPVPPPRDRATRRLLATTVEAPLPSPAASASAAPTGAGGGRAPSPKPKPSPKPTPSPTATPCPTAAPTAPTAHAGLPGVTIAVAPSPSASPSASPTSAGGGSSAGGVPPADPPPCAA